jgi:FkbM family methyltransferase
MLPTTAPQHNLASLASPELGLTRATQRHDDLIYDVGMHRGEDSSFYLAKGYRVVAVDADAAHVESAHERFAQEIAEGRLVVEHRAVTDCEGPVQFYRDLDHDDWGTILPTVAERNERRGSRSEKIEVPGTRLSSIMLRHGVPYYLKVDIEGADTTAISSLLDLDMRPRYLSVEVDLTATSRAGDQVELLLRLGYRRLQLVNMLALSQYRLPNPATEGNYVDQRFDGYMSGSFASETPGPWTTSEAVFARLPSLVRDARRWGVDGRFPFPSMPHRLHSKTRRILGRPTVSWYDLHASLE